MKPNAHLCLENVGLVYSILNRYRGFGIDAEDLFQETALEYFQNAEKCDPSQLGLYLGWRASAALRRIIRDRQKNAAMSLGELDENVPDREQPTLDDGHERGRIREALRHLRARDRAIVVRRFGLEGEEPESMQAIADRFGVSKERVRQILRRTLDTLRRGPLGSVKGGATCRS